MSASRLESRIAALRGQVRRFLALYGMGWIVGLLDPLLIHVGALLMQIHQPPLLAGQACPLTGEVRPLLGKTRLFLRDGVLRLRPPLAHLTEQCPDLLDGDVQPFGQVSDRRPRVALPLGPERDDGPHLVLVQPLGEVGSGGG